MKNKLLISLIILATTAAKSQNVFPGTGKVGIGNTAPTYSLDVSGDTRITKTLILGATAAEAVTMSYAAKTATSPAMFKFAVPAGTKPFNAAASGSSGGVSGDPQPNLACLTGSLPGFVNAFQQALSISYNPTNTAITGGQLLMGHNGFNAFLETQGTGTLSGANNPGDLFINKFCNRNVMFFQHATPFAISQTKVVSIDGSLNVRSNMQIGDAGQTFADLNSKLYLYNSITSDNGIRIKHGGFGKGIKIASYNAATAFAVSSSTTIVNDGNETFKIEGDGQTTITTANVDAFLIRDAANSNQLNFKVAKTGKTIIGYQAGATNAAFLNVNINSTLTAATADNAIDVFDQTSNKINFRVKASGWVYAREVNIQVAAFPDYVFNSNYKYTPLSDLENYVNTNKHLPGVPTAAEIEKNGANLGDLSKIQMEKIEELALYIIELKKELEALKKQVSAK
jgi:hypothetical protein